MNKKWQLRLISLLIALFLWFQQTLIRDYTQKINIPIKVVNIPKNYIIFSQNTKSLSFEITARGFNLLRIKFIDKITYKVDAHKFKYWKNYILISPKNLSIPKNIKFSHIKYSDKFKNIEIVLDELVKNKKTIIANFTDKNSKEFYKNKNIYLSPSIATVVGPKSIVRQISSLFTEKISLSDLKKKTSVIKIIYPTSKIKIFPNQTYLKFDKKIITTKIFNNIKIKLPNNFSKKIIPNSILVKITAKNDDVDKITSKDISAIISKIDKDSTLAEIKVKINKNVKIIEYTPKVVQVTE